MMKLNFLKYKTKSLLKRNKTLRNNVPWDKATSVGIIFTVEDKQKHEYIKDFIKKLEHDGKQVKVLEYLPEKTDNYEFRFDFFTDKDINFWGTLRSDAAHNFGKQAFDFLFYIDLAPQPQVLHILADSKALCRVGRHWEQGDVYLEFMIESVNAYPPLLDNIYKYISQLR